MPLKSVKKDMSDALTLEWILHTKHFKLILDKKRCVDCEICFLACPKEAIKLEPPSQFGGKASEGKVDINLPKCNFCGICDVSCPYGAIKLTLNGERALSVVEKESYPELIREIHVDPSRCPTECIKCEEACPLSLIKVTRLIEGKPDGNFFSLTENETINGTALVDIRKDYCPCCRICEFNCPEGVIKVKKFFQGKILINQEKCPDGCADCLDACPVTGALYLSDKDRKVSINELFCVYCGACKIVCPENEALLLKRTKIIHTPVSSGAWNKALERLASPVEMVKELKARGFQKARKSVCKRLNLEVA